MSRSFGSITRREAVLGLLAGVADGRALRAQAPTRPSVRPERLNHIAFFASDVKRTVEWYQRFFGMPVQFRPEGAVLRLGDGPEFIAIFPANGAKTGFKHMGFGVRGFARGPIDQALAAHGIKGEWSRRPAAEGDVEELRVRDPDGITIQIQDLRYAGGGGPLGDAWARPWTPAPPPQKPIIASRSINHITFGSASKERVERFYADVFGLPMISWDYRPREPSKLFALSQANPREFVAPGQGPLGVSHYCLGVPGFDRARLVRVLTEHGLKTPPPVDRPGCCGSKVVYEASETLFGLRDPDGFSVQLADVEFCAGIGPLGTVCIPG
jgi:catechol 2,3-dioxygenase-like lactoylglutathione lyase family enzyme